MRVESRRLFYLRFTFTRPPGGVKLGSGLWRAPWGARAQANLCAAGASLFPSSPSLCVVTDRRRTLNTRTTFRVTALYVMYACVPGRCRSVLARLPREQAGAVNITSGARA